MKKFFSEPRFVIKFFETENLILMSVGANGDFGGQGNYASDAEWQE